MKTSQANLYGLYIIDGPSMLIIILLLTMQNRAAKAASCIKVCLAANQRAYFNGKVFVRKDAQKTNAYQSNKAMLLSKDAMIDTKPQLEILLMMLNALMAQL